MSEAEPAVLPEIKSGPEEVTRRLIVVENRSGIQLKDFDPWVVDNQAQFGEREDDVASMVRAHENAKYQGTGTRVLGVSVDKRDTLERVLPDGTSIRFVEDPPRTVNHWVGESVQLLTPEEASKTPYAGKTALEWASQGGVTPAMVVRANNSYFYPAGINDKVVSSIPMTAR